MFNWYSAPTFAGTLLFWLLAAYVLTRSPRNSISLTAVAALVSTAGYLLGEGIAANASTPDAWRPWARSLRWGAPAAATAWYWVTALLLREQESVAAQRYLRRIGYPLGALCVAAGVVFAASIYVDDWLWGWSTPVQVATEHVPYVRHYPPAGPLYSAFVLFILAAYLGAAVNLWLGWRLTRAEGRRRRFAWLVLSAMLFIPEVGSIAAHHWFKQALPTWLNHLALGGATALMASNVAAYNRLRHGRAIRTDLLYFLAAWAIICGTYIAVSVLAGPGYSFQLLELLAITIFLVILAHALTDDGRRLFDRLFFGPEVQRLRSNLTTVVQDAALTKDQDLSGLLAQAQGEIAAVSRDYLVRLTGEALRCLNNPAALAKCGLIARLPRTLAAVRAGRGNPESAEATPLEQAQALREALALAIERLKPPDGETGLGAPAALQYHILREEYFQGLPNAQIMIRHSISEGTFHRNRRAAIMILAQDLGRQESVLSRGEVDRA